MSASVGEADAKADMAGVTNTEALVQHESIVQHESVVKHDSAVQHAEQLLQQGRPREAERLLRPVLAQQPEDVDARYALAVAQRHQHRWQEALATLGWHSASAAELRAGASGNRLQPHRPAGFRGGAGGVRGGGGGGSGARQQLALLDQTVRGTRSAKPGHRGQAAGGARPSGFSGHPAARTPGGDELPRRRQTRGRGTALQALLARQQNPCGGNAPAGGNPNPQQSAGRGRVFA